MTGFTLLELVVVLVIVATLLVLALPSYQGHLRDTRRALAGAALLEAVIRQEQFFLDHKRYAERLTDLDFPAHPFAINRDGNAVVDDADDRIYLIDLATGANTYTFSATPQLGQAADRLCGTLSLDWAGTRRASGELGPDDCW